MAPKVENDLSIRSQDTICAVGSVSLTGVSAGDIEYTNSERAISVRNNVANRLLSYVDSIQNGAPTLLRRHQIEVFGDIANFVAQPPVENDKPVTFGYVKLPTGSGKTAIFSTLAGILSTPDKDTPPLRGLVLVPKLDLVDQTKGQVGVDGVTITGGIGAFAPNTSVGAYTGLEKSLEGNVIVMTYDSLRIAVQEGTLTPGMFDYFICDEAHRALGNKTTDAIRKIAEGRVVLGFTATTEFKNKSVDSVFPEEIHSVELREAIELGWLSQVRAYAIETGVTLESLSGSSDFSNIDLLPLIESEWRNSKAVDFVKALVENGQQGLVSCVPGDDLAHAKLIAKRLNETQIADPKTGEFRNIKAVAVSGTMKSHERQQVYTDYEAGLLDVLTYVDLQTEGWDSYKAQFLINLRPTSSPVNAVQRIGRVLRKAEGKVATVIEFIDHSERPIYTFWHAIGEDTVEQGKIIPIITTEQITEDIDATLEKSIELTLPDSLIELLSRIEGIPMREIVVEEKKQFVTEHDLILRDVLSELHMTRRTLRRIIEDAGQELVITPKIGSEGRKLLTIEKVAFASVLGDIETGRPRRDNEVFKARTLTEVHSIALGTLTKLLNDQGISLRRIAVISDGGTCNVALVISDQDVERAAEIAQKYAEDRNRRLIVELPQETFKEGDVTMVDLKHVYGLGTKKFDDFLSSLSPEEALKVNVEIRGGREIKFVHPAEAERIYDLFVERQGYMESMLSDVYELARLTGVLAKGMSILDFEQQVTRTNESLAKLFITKTEGNKTKIRLPRKYLKKFIAMYRSL